VVGVASPNGRFLGALSHGYAFYGFHVGRKPRFGGPILPLLRGRRLCDSTIDPALQAPIDRGTQEDSLSGPGAAARA